ncbi:unnamed protein product [Gongylonema pulchrum]|uniref:Mediator of RNA polymerase II transcription subunit 6 n=1 Tax=Gongylonema pulchrum TaxID=637853 RepID=A0A183DXX0_9BILA|nr:unnamed protein product [Gongylonema pulchrum]
MLVHNGQCYVMSTAQYLGNSQQIAAVRPLDEPPVFLFYDSPVRYDVPLIIERFLNSEFHYWSEDQIVQWFHHSTSSCAVDHAFPAAAAALHSAGYFDEYCDAWANCAKFGTEDDSPKSALVFITLNTRPDVASLIVKRRKLLKMGGSGKGFAENSVLRYGTPLGMQQGDTSSLRPAQQRSSTQQSQQQQQQPMYPQEMVTSQQRYSHTAAYADLQQIPAFTGQAVPTSQPQNQQQSLAVQPSANVAAAAAATALPQKVAVPTPIRPTTSSVVDSPMPTSTEQDGCSTAQQTSSGDNEPITQTRPGSNLTPSPSVKGAEGSSVNVKGSGKQPGGGRKPAGGAVKSKCFGRVPPL